MGFVLGFSVLDDRRIPQHVLATLRPPGLGGAVSFRLPYSHQYAPYTLQAPFFYQDERRTYFVAPDRVADVPAQLADPNEARPSLAANFVSRVNSNSVSVSTAAASGQLKLTPTVLEQIESTLPEKSSVQDRALASVTAGQQPTVTPDSGIGPTWNDLTICPGDGSFDDLEFDSRRDRRPTVFKLRLSTFYHPHVCAFIKALKRTGIRGLLGLGNQKRSDFTQNGEQLPGDNRRTLFKIIYNPTPLIDLNYPKEDVDFEGGAYSLYNWEFFFHAPLLIALRLSKNQRFEEARQWFHYVFDPTDDSNEPVPRRFWKVLPFHLNDRVAQDQIGELLRLLPAPEVHSQGRW